MLDLGPATTPRAAVADSDYASKANVNAARPGGASAVIPHKTNEKDKPVHFTETIYRGRARAEQAIEELKRFKRLVQRCERT